MDNIDGQRKLTSHDSSQNEQQDGANHGDDRERQSEETKTREGAQLAPEALRGYVSPSRALRKGGEDSKPPTASPTLTVSVKAPAQPVAVVRTVQEDVDTEEDTPSNGSLDLPRATLAPTAP